MPTTSASPAAGLAYRSLPIDAGLRVDACPEELAALIAGIRGGRRAFANPFESVFMATSANFGNMVSMAGASLLLPKRILLADLLTDLPEMTIAGDRVDRDRIARPHRGSIPFIRRFMLCVGLVCSVFVDGTFAVLLLLLHDDAARFRLGWFVESVLSVSLIVPVIRSRTPLGLSRASRPDPHHRGGDPDHPGAVRAGPGEGGGFVLLPPHVLAVLGMILVASATTAALVKRLFYRWGSGREPRSGAAGCLQKSHLI